MPSATMRNCEGIFRSVCAISCGFARNPRYKYHFSTLLQEQRPNSHLISLEPAGRMCCGMLTEVHFLVSFLEGSKSCTFSPCTHPSLSCPYFSYNARRKYRIKKIGLSDYDSRQTGSCQTLKQIQNVLCLITKNVTTPFCLATSIFQFTKKGFTQ